MLRFSYLAETISRLAGDISGVALLAALAMLLIGVAVPRWRRLAASLLTAYLVGQGIQLWLWSVAFLLARFKLWVLILGLCFAGVGVVPAAFFGALLTGLWRGAVSVALTCLLLFAVRVFTRWYSARFVPATEPPRIPVSAPAQ
jgi:hypothetical protein